LVVNHMARTVDLQALRKRTTASLDASIARYDSAVRGQFHYSMLRWIAKMTAVEIHGAWERYVEQRLVAALNHNPRHFVSQHNIKGVSRVSSGLALYVIRGGGKYFDVRSTAELLEKGDRLLGKSANPFRQLTPQDRSYLDALAAVRNCIVHGSDAALASYKRALRSAYGIKSAPGPDEFLHARDWRSASPARYQSRLQGLGVVVACAVSDT
jgi:hypothetical protein